MTLTALDLFAGTGWGVACQWLGIEEIGVELMPEARATREANGMRNAYADVWEGLDDPSLVPPHALLIASPPCQTFSMAGKGAGRAALDEVLGLIDSRAYLDPAKLRAFGEKHDPRTALVLTPLAYVAAHVPMYVVLEQVPPVRPVFERIAEVLRSWGYSVVVEVLKTERYGVPQTRKRCVLIARADGVEARMPTASHSQYYERDRKRLDPGLLPWVSMSEAIGRMSGQRSARWLESSYTSNGEHSVARPGSKTARGKRHEHEPASVITSKAGSMLWGQERPATTIMADARLFAPGHKTNATDEAAGRSYPGRPEGAVKLTLEEAAALQSYPADFEWHPLAPNRYGKMTRVSDTKAFLQVGNAVPPLLARAVLSTIVEGDPQ